jgi:hypothetical protein
MAQPKTRRPVSLKTQYLILYNLNSALLWLVVLGRVVFGVPEHGFGATYEAVGQFAKLTQTVAVLEIIHAATGKNPPRAQLWPWLMCAGSRPRACPYCYHWHAGG